MNQNKKKKVLLLSYYINPDDMSVPLETYGNTAIEEPL